MDPCLGDSVEVVSGYLLLHTYFSYHHVDIIEASLMMDGKEG